MRYLFYTIMLLIVFFSQGCRVVRQLPEGAQLLHSNKVSVDEHTIDREELATYFRQKPNRKILGFIPFHLSIYNYGNYSKEHWWNKGIKKWFKRIGEEPVLYDSTLVSLSANQLKLYMFRKGYFNATVTHHVALTKRKASVHYQITAGQPYLFDTIQYLSADTLMQANLLNDSSQRLLIHGHRYDEDLMDAERKRLADNARNQGYYYFNKNYFSYAIDSANQNYTTNVNLLLARFNEGLKDSLPSNHLQYAIRNIYFQTDYNSRLKNDPQIIHYSNYKGYFFDTTLTMPLRRSILLSCTFLKPGDLYQQKEMEYTTSRLFDLNTFRFIAVKYIETNALDTHCHCPSLDVFIQLTMQQQQDFTLETEATNNGGNLGLAGSFGYRNKNTFKGAESFEFKIRTALESLRNFTLNTNQVRKLYFFNTFEFGPELNLSFKRLLLPRFVTNEINRRYIPKTTISVSFNYQDRPDFIRSVTNASIGYSLRTRPSTRFYWFPLELNSVKVALDPSFFSKLVEIRDLQLLYSYFDHLVYSGRFTYSYNNQKTKKNFWYLRTTVESAGLMASLLASGNGLNQNGTRNLLGLEYSQYIKPDLDLSYHHRINENNTIVYRFAGGIGYSYLNSRNRSLPFDRAFFGGGANGIRAWQARTLGPGSYTNPLNIEQLGDIKLETNLEYRSQIIKRFEAALFIDAGNVWLRPGVQGILEGAGFNTNQFINEIAVGGGAGARLDFSFFIIRFDFALKLRNPALPVNQRWVYPNQKFQLNDFVANFAIGHPF